MRRPDRRERRRAAAAKGALRDGVAEPVRGQRETSSELHEERLRAVAERLLESGAKTVLDLGCGSGSLLRLLLEHGGFSRLAGVEPSNEALRIAERLLEPTGALEDGRVVLVHGALDVPDERLKGYDAAAMVEVIEHIEPGELWRVERAVFGGLRPGTVVLTTPNREYNELYGLAPGELRHAGHRFEWPRSRFRAWADGVSERSGYGVSFHDIGPSDPLLGSPTQMAVFATIAPHGHGL